MRRAPVKAQGGKEAEAGMSIFMLTYLRMDSGIREICLPQAAPPGGGRGGKEVARVLLLPVAAPGNLFSASASPWCRSMGGSKFLVFGMWQGGGASLMAPPKRPKIQFPTWP